MFRICLNKITLLYAECPASGLPAVDWRRARGLADQPDNRAGLIDPYSWRDESLCRTAAAHLDDDADFCAGPRKVAVSVPTAAILLSGEGSPSLPDPADPAVRAAYADLLQALTAGAAK